MIPVIAAAALLASFPIGLAIRHRPGAIRALVLLLPVLAFVDLDVLDVDLIADLAYRGDARGIQITALDVIAGMLLGALPRPAGKLPDRWAWLAYAGVAALSGIAAPVPLYWLFGMWKIARGALVLVVAWRASAVPELAGRLTTGLGIGTVVAGVAALAQRYVLGLHQTPAFYEHQNSLGMAVNVVTPIALAVLLAGPRWKLAAATVAAGAVCVVLSLSRGALVLYVVGCAIVVGGSLLRRFSKRLAVVVVALAAFAVLLGTRSADTILERVLGAPASSLSTREQFVEAADRMHDDHPLGIGLGQYPYVLEHGGYADAVHLSGLDRDGMAHHVYWLTLAEMGWLGLAAFLVMVIAPVLRAARGAIRLQDVRGDVLLGAGAGLVTMAVHGTAEWAWRQMPLIDLFAIVVGLVSGLSIRPPEDGRQRLRQ